MVPLIWDIFQKCFIQVKIIWYVRYKIVLDVVWLNDVDGVLMNALNECGQLIKLKKHTLQIILVRPYVVR